MRVNTLGRCFRTDRICIIWQHLIQRYINFFKTLTLIEIGQTNSCTHSQNAFTNVIWKMVAILSRYHCDNWPSILKPPDQRSLHDDIIKWKHGPRYWPFVRGIHRSPVNSPHKGQWGGSLMFSLICAWTNGWVNARDVDDLRRHRAHYDFTVMPYIGSLMCIRFSWDLIFMMVRSPCR